MDNNTTKILGNDASNNENNYNPDNIFVDDNKSNYDNSDNQFSDTDSMPEDISNIGNWEPQMTMGTIDDLKKLNEEEINKEVKLNLFWAIENKNEKLLNEICQSIIKEDIKIGMYFPTIFWKSIF